MRTGKRTVARWLEEGRAAEESGRFKPCSACGGTGQSGTDGSGQSVPCFECWSSGDAHEFRAFAVGYSTQRGVFLTSVELNLAAQAKVDHRAGVWILRNLAPDVWPGMHAPAAPNAAPEGGNELADIDRALKRAQLRKVEAEADLAATRAEAITKTGAGGLLVMEIEAILDDPDVPQVVNDGVERWLVAREAVTMTAKDLGKPS